MISLNWFIIIHTRRFRPRTPTPTEHEALSAIFTGHSAMTTILANRHRKLRFIRALWSRGNVKTVVDSALSMQVFSRVLRDSAPCFARPSVRHVILILFVLTNNGNCSDWRQKLGGEWPMLRTFFLTAIAAITGRCALCIEFQKSACALKS